MDLRKTKLALTALFLVPVVLLSLSGCWLLNVQTSFLVGAIPGSRFDEEYWNLDGFYMTDSVLKLTNPANFGPSGTVRLELQTATAGGNQGDVTTALLSGFDIFFIGYFDDGDANAITSDELDAFYNWVSSGGVMIVTCDDSNHDAVCERFGYPSIDTATSPTVPTGNNPVFNGPFGNISEVAMEGDMGTFSDPTGAKVLGADSSGSPLATVLKKKIGSGSVLLVGDIDMMTTYGAISAGADINNDNDRFLANLFYYATQLVK